MWLKRGWQQFEQFSDDEMRMAMNYLSDNFTKDTVLVHYRKAYQIVMRLRQPENQKTVESIDESNLPWGEQMATNEEINAALQGCKDFINANKKKSENTFGKSRRKPGYTPPEPI